MCKTRFSGVIVCLLGQGMARGRRVLFWVVRIFIKGFYRGFGPRGPVGKIVYGVNCVADVVSV